jgi:hypothetical protein
MIGLARPLRHSLAGSRSGTVATPYDNRVAISIMESVSSPFEYLPMRVTASSFIAYTDNR